MTETVGLFTIEDSFCLTDRGLVLLGEVEGQVATGHQLIFENSTHWRIKGVDFTSLRNRQGKFGLLVDAPLATREELVQRGIIGAKAQIVAP